MKILTEGTPDGMWRAIDLDSFDGPESPIGCGDSPSAAMVDLLQQLYEETT